MRYFSQVRRRITMRFMLVVILALPALVMAQTGEEADVWAPLRPLVGEWEGSGAGGGSQVEARYNFVLGEKFLEARHRAVFAPDEKNPQGEVHEDWGLISYDHNRKKFVFRQFHVEGFVNRYVLDSLSTDGRTLIFLSEDVENGPPGTRAKLHLTFEDEDHLTSAFHIAWPGKDFECYTENYLTRKR
jgi:hypothetical protein